MTTEEAFRKAFKNLGMNGTANDYPVIMPNQPDRKYTGIAFEAVNPNTGHEAWYTSYVQMPPTEVFADPVKEAEKEIRAVLDRIYDQGEADPTRGSRWPYLQEAAV